jgi:hypothetical protein
MDVQINMLAIVLATLSSMVVGATWYAPKVFGNKWLKLIGKKPKDMQGGSAAPMVLTLIASFFTAYVLAHVTYLSNHFFQHSFMHDALMTGFWVWLGFVAARIITHDAFEMRPRALTLMTVAHEFLTIMVMALIIGAIKP